MSTEESPTQHIEEPESDTDAPPSQPDERAPEGDTERADVASELVDADEPDKWDGWVGEGEPPPLRGQG